MSNGAVDSGTDVVIFRRRIMVLMRQAHVAA